MTDHFYQTLPYDFGLKRPTNLDHLRKVKDKVKLMEIISDICLAEKCLINSLVSQIIHTKIFFVQDGFEGKQSCQNFVAATPYKNQAYVQF